MSSPKTGKKPTAAPARYLASFPHGLELIDPASPFSPHLKFPPEQQERLRAEFKRLRLGPEVSGQATEALFLARERGHHHLVLQKMNQAGRERLRRLAAEDPSRAKGDEPSTPRPGGHM